jgi:Flp pilus assembly protein TadD
MQAVGFYQIKEYEQALIQYQHAIQENPRDVEAWNGLASALESLKRYDEAIDAYTHAIELAPNDAYLYRNRANILLELDRLDEAERDIARAVELEPEHAYTHARQGYLALARGQFADAVAHLQYAAEHDDSVNWQCGLALAKLGQGDAIGAREILTAVMPRADADDLHNCLEWLERVVKSQPDLSEKAQPIRELLKTGK